MRGINKLYTENVAMFDALTNQRFDNLFDYHVARENLFARLCQEHNENYDNQRAIETKNLHEAYLEEFSPKPKPHSLDDLYMNFDRKPETVKLINQSSSYVR